MLSLTAALTRCGAPARLAALSTCASALLLGALGCSEPRPATLPQGEGVAAPFPGAGFTWEPTPPPLPIPPPPAEAPPSRSPATSWLRLEPPSGDWDYLPPNHRIALAFNLPVEPAALREHLRVVKRLDGADLPVPFELTAAEAAPDGAPPQGGSAFLLSLRGGFERGAHYRVTLDAGLSGPAGAQGLQQPWSADLHIADPLQVYHLGCDEPCTASSLWTLDFNSPVDAEAIAPCLSTHPKLALRVKPNGGDHRVVIQPVHVRPGATYTLTMTPRCADVWGGSLAAPFSEPLQISYAPAYVRMADGLTSLEPPASASDPLQLPVTVRNVKEVRVKLLRVTPDDLAALHRVFRPPQRGQEEPVFKALTPQVDRLVARSPRLEAPQTYGINLREVLGPPGLGVAYVAVEGAPAHPSASDEGNAPAAWGLVQVTDLSLLVKDSPGSSLIWTTHRATGAPAPGVRVSMRALDGARLWEGVTDAEGLARGPGAFDSGPAGPRLLIAEQGHDMSYTLISRKDQWTNLKDRDNPRAAPQAPARGFFFTERGVFHPGEEVHIKGYLRLEPGRGQGGLPPTDVTLTITDPRNSVLHTSTLRSSPLGALDLQVALPASAPLGAYTISARPASPDAPLKIDAAGSFRVEGRLAPAGEVAVAPAATPGRPGEPASWTISARRPTGGELSGAQVRWRLTATDADLHPAGLDGFTFGGERADRAGGDAEAPPVKHGASSLDSSGSLEVVTAPPGVTPSSPPQLLTLEATVTADNTSQSVGRGEQLWHPAEVYVGLRRPGELVKAGEPLRVDVVAVAPGGALVPGQPVEVTLKRRGWRSVRKESVLGLNRMTEPAEEVVGRCAVTTGAAPTPCALELQQPGEYVLEGATLDRLGRASRTTARVYAWGDGACEWEPRDDQRVNLVLDKPSYRVGDTARVLIQSPFPEAWALVTVERRGVLQRWTHLLRSAAATVAIPITEDLAAGARVSVVLSRGRGAASVAPGEPDHRVGYAELNVPADAQRLQVRVEPTQPAYRRGEEVVVKLGLRDAGGEPVAGEITFMAVDDAGLALTGYQTPDPLEALDPPGELEVITSGSLLRKMHDNYMDFTVKSPQRAAPGGGAATSYQPAAATTAAFMPRVEVGADGAAQVRFKLSRHAAALRLMAVGVAEGGRFGSGEARVATREILPAYAATPLLQWSESGAAPEGDDPGWIARRLALPAGVHPELGGLDITLTSAAPGELLPVLDGPGVAPDGSAEELVNRLLPQLTLSELRVPVDLQDVQEGLDRLMALQTQGGLASRPGDAEPHPWASAYGALPLVLASRSDPSRVDQARLNRLLDHLASLLNRRLHAIAHPHLTRAMAAYALALAGRLEPRQIDHLFAQRAEAPHLGRALLALAFSEAGAETDKVRRLLLDLWGEVEADGAAVRLPREPSGSADVPATALFLLGLLKAGPGSPLLPRLAAGLLEDRRGGRWGTPRESAFAVMALSAWLVHTGRDAPSSQARVFLDDDEVLAASLPQQPATVHLPMRQLLQHPGGLLTVLRDGERGPLYYTLTLRYAEAPAASQASPGRVDTRAPLAYPPRGLR